MTSSEPETTEFTAARVREAAEALDGFARRTPLVEVRLGGRAAFAKLENLQHTGSFKYRGALATLKAALAEGPVSSCVTYSAGNHGRGVARAAKSAGIAATVVMPDSCEPGKVVFVEGEGATATLVQPDRLAATAKSIAAETGAVFIHPFDQPSVMAGQGTVGLEILEQSDDVDVILVPVGGGGLISGIATIAAELSPKTQVIAVEPERAGDLAESLQAGEIVTWSREQTFTTVADGLRSPAVGVEPWAVIRERVAEALTVSEQSILEAMRELSAQTNTLVEPSGAVAAAALLEHGGRFEGKRVAVVVTGGNIAPHRFAELYDLVD
jgi:threonine dehydratase